MLVIDDDKQVVKLIRNNEYEVVTASTGVEGIEKHRAHPADVVITDMLSPGIQGTETIASLRREFPELKIIAMTSAALEDMNDFLKAAREYGATYGFQKPFRLEEMLDAVNQIILENANRISTD